MQQSNNNVLPCMAGDIGHRTRFLIASFSSTYDEHRRDDAFCRRLEFCFIENGSRNEEKNRRLDR